MSSMSMMSPATTALMTAAMMVAMMLPSIAPTLWRYHHHLGGMQVRAAHQRIALVGVGYASVWATIGLALFAMSAHMSTMTMTLASHPPFPLLPAGTIVLCAGRLQRSRWKAKQLVRCQDACMAAHRNPTGVTTALLDGCRLGVACGLSCAAPMAVLFVAGLMDARIMVLITAAITAERVAPAGARVARLTGSLAMIAGLIMCV